MKTKLFVILSTLFLLVFVSKAISQEKITASGKVCYGTIPLNNVYVRAMNSDEFTHTDTLGRFSLKSLENDAITFSASGFETKKLKVKKLKEEAIELEFRNNPENFNKAVNNGHISENSLQKAILQIQKKNEKDYSIYQSIYQLISSEVYEVTVTGTTVLNKKRRSTDGDPKVLFVVDGKIVSDISFVNPNSVKAIEFIDDAGATMWGVQGGNGVLKITLK